MRSWAWIVGAAMAVLGAAGDTLAADPNDPLYAARGTWQQPFADQWALRQLRIYGSATPSATEPQPSPVVVAVIDTGIDYEHPDFASSQLWRNPRETRNGRDDDNNGYVDDLIGWNFVAANNNPWDQSGHGTHVAGAIAACTDNRIGIAAVNPQARIMALKVANFAGQARSSAVAAALYYAVDQGAQVINLSLGGELATPLEQRAAAYAQERGVLLVVSAGNRGLRLDSNGYPGLPGALVVGASDLDGERAGFSNFGPRLDLLAPGVDLLSLRARDTDFIGLSEPLDYEAGAATVGADAAYYRASGTSFSAALVSGVASRLLSREPTLTGEQLRNLLLQSAVDVGATGIDQLAGFGRLDFTNALTADPNGAIFARLSGVHLTLEDERILLHIEGVAQASEFASAALAVRPEQEKAARAARRNGQSPVFDPTVWQPLPAALDQPVANGVVATIALDDLIALTGGARAWELQLTVKDRSGRSRAATLAVALPAERTVAEAVQ